VSYLLEAGDADAPGRRAAAGRKAGSEVASSARSLDADAVRLVLERLERLKRELAGILANAGTDYRSFTASSLTSEVDRLIADATRDLSTGARSILASAGGLGVAAVEAPITAARIGLTPAPKLDATLLTHASEITADLLSEPMQRFRNQVIAGIRRAAITASSGEEVKLRGIIDAAGFDAAAFKAERIVRTELARVLNASTYARMVSLAADMPFLRKGWRASRDSRVRLGHKEAGVTYARGQGIPIGEPFQVNVYFERGGKPPKFLGVASLRFPVDPEASPAGRLAAGATIMCRCNAFTDFSLEDLRAWSTSRKSITVPDAAFPTGDRGFAEPPIGTKAPARPPKLTTIPKAIKAPATEPTRSGDPHFAPELEGPGRRWGINEDWLKAVAKDTAENIRAWLARDLNRTPTLEELQRFIEKEDRHLRDVIGRAEIYSRARLQSLDQIMRDGRFKSQFETNSSGGTLDPSFRAEVEGKMMGLPRDLDPARRPIYGYLAEGPGGGSLSGYGEVAIKFKPGVRDRSTFTIGDSFGTYANVNFEPSAPSPVSNPRYWSFPWAKDASHLEVLSETVRNAGRVGRRSYTEVQMHGGVKTSDIEEVIFPSTISRRAGGLGNLSGSVPIQDSPYYKAITAELEKLGIKWRIDAEYF
jgi:hypothetical protein